MKTIYIILIIYGSVGALISLCCSLYSAKNYIDGYFTAFRNKPWKGGTSLLVRLIPNLLFDEFLPSILVSIVFAIIWGIILIWALVEFVKNPHRFDNVSSLRELEPPQHFTV